jgi:hypothetical protein
MGEKAIQGGVVKELLLLRVFGRWVAHPVLKPVAADGDVQAKNAWAVELGELVEALVVLRDDCRERKPTVRGVSPSRS